MVQILKALADETRLRLMALLARGDFNVNELVEVLQTGQSRVSHHLKILADSGLVRNRREGNWIYYSLANSNGGDRGLVEAFNLGLKAAASLSTHEADLRKLESVVQRRRSLSTKYFDRIGSSWERLQQEVLDSTYYRQQVLSYLPGNGNVAADLGTGSGYLLPMLLSKFDSVLAIDASQTMLKVAADCVAAEIPDRAAACEFRLGELEHLPIPDNHVDAAVACMVLHHISNPAEALQEASRIMKPGGMLVIADLLQHNVTEMREKYADLWMGFDPKQLRKWLRGAGLKVVRHEVLKKSEVMKILMFQSLKP